MDTVKGVVDGVKNVALTDNSKPKVAKEKKDKKDKKGGDANEDSRSLEVGDSGTHSYFQIYIVELRLILNV